MSRVRQLSKPVRLALVGGVAIGITALPSLAFAVAGDDPPGANGTVKIDALEFDGGIDNEPHVTCDFRVTFFNFDGDERANIVFTAQKPTGSGEELLRQDDVLVSDDPAGGGKPDPDEAYVYSATQLGLDAYEAHPKQGYHVKLTVEREDGKTAGKHKVFWIEACPPVSPTPSPSVSPTVSPSVSPTASPSASPTASPTGSPTASPTSPSPSGTASSPTTPAPTHTAPGDGGGGGLPKTGVAVGGIVATGVGMIAGGLGLLLVRRRRNIADLTE